MQADIQGIAACSSSLDDESPKKENSIFKKPGLGLVTDAADETS